MTAKPEPDSLEKVIADLRIFAGLMSTWPPFTDKHPDEMEPAKIAARLESLRGAEPVAVDQIEERDHLASVFRRIIDMPATTERRSLDCADYAIKVRGAEPKGGDWQATVNAVMKSLGESAEEFGGLAGDAMRRAALRLSMLLISTDIAEPKGGERFTEDEREAIRVANNALWGTIDLQQREQASATLRALLSSAQPSKETA